MNKLILSLCVLLVLSVSLSAQKPAPPAAKPAVGAPGRPMPYVLKKDYDPTISELRDRINSALGAASSARREIIGGFERVTMLDSQVQQILEVLRSANFQIGVTSDSLKMAKASMEEFRIKAEADILALQKEHESQKMMMWILFGVATLMGLIGIILPGSKIGKVEKKVKNMEGELKRTLVDDMQKQHASLQKEVKDEMLSVKGRIQIDVGALRTELKSAMNKDAEANKAALGEIREKLGMSSEG